MANLRIAPATRPLQGVIPIPADKSISHRAVILSALSEGAARIDNFLASETTSATVSCLRALGVEIEPAGADALCVQGRGLHGLREPDNVLFCLGSGTTIRLLAGLVAGQDFLSVLDGTPALKRRPMGRVLDPLRAMGATVLGRNGDRLPPLAIRGARPLHGITYTLPVASAQVKSALLLAGLYADSPVMLGEPGPSRDHTERMLSAMGVRVESSAPGMVCLTPPERLAARDLTIPNDFSSAAFFLVAALILRGSAIRMPHVGLNATRTGLAVVVAAMGAEIRVENEGEVCGEPVGDILVGNGHDLRGTEIAGGLIPRMIDEFPILAVAATQAHGETRVRDAAELRVKESDRIATLTGELRKMGAQIEPYADGFTIVGPTRLQGAPVRSHGDHRLAMSLAVAALIAQGETTIEGWECVADSFPGFDTLLAGVQA
ncbi:MAG: 3-phosphoshikimate 1-carboxyvinyltransferase [Anaerolineae bacterium]